MSSSEPRPQTEIIAEFRDRQADFERRLWDQWKPAFDLYDWVLIQAQNAAVFMLRHHRQEAIEQKDALFEALTRLQARAYRTACEVRALLLSGNPEGALGRWRVIHEILIVMRFLQQHGTETAQRFLDYDLVQTAENWDHYEKMPPEWQVLSLSPEDRDQARDDRAKVVGKYGAAFQNENGWACAALGLTKDTSRVALARLEEVVSLTQFRFYYHIASNHIHVNMKGLTDDLREHLGPTVHGFSAAAGTTLWGLAESTTIMANLRPTSETEMLEQAIGQAVIDAGQKFIEIDARVGEG